ARVGGALRLPGPAHARDHELRRGLLPAGRDDLLADRALGRREALPRQARRAQPGGLVSGALAVGCALLPGLALWLCYPRRSWPAVGALGAALAAGAASVALAPDEGRLGAGISAVAVCL